MRSGCCKMTWWFLPLLTVAAGPSAAATELDGYAEPLRTIAVASDETGTVQELFVREGQRVSTGEPLIRLNCEVHQAMLAVAAQNMSVRGRLNAATADLTLQRERLRKLTQLRSEGFARQEEVDRAANEVTVAEANVLAAHEELATRRLEFERLEAQMNRRTVRAPVDGVVVRVHKEVGEFVAPNSPEVVTLVDVDTLLANFTLLSSQAARLAAGQRLPLRFVDSGVQTDGIVDFISPVIHAESGTVLVKFRVSNHQGQLRSGERCKLQIKQ